MMDSGLTVIDQTQTTLKSALLVQSGAPKTHPIAPGWRYVTTRPVTFTQIIVLCIQTTSKSRALNTQLCSVSIRFHKYY